MEQVITAHLKESYINLLYNVIPINNIDFKFRHESSYTCINEYLLLKKNDQFHLYIQLIICQESITLNLPINKIYFKWVKNILIIYQTAKRIIEWYDNGELKSIRYNNGFDIFYNIDNNESFKVFFKDVIGYKKIANKHYFFFRDQDQLNLYRWI